MAGQPYLSGGCSHEWCSILLLYADLCYCSMINLAMALSWRGSVTHVVVAAMVVVHLYVHSFYDCDLETLVSWRGNLTRVVVAAMNGVRFCCYMQTFVIAP